MICLKQTISLQNFKGCLPQILLGSFLNTLSHISHLGSDTLKENFLLKPNTRGCQSINISINILIGPLSRGLILARMGDKVIAISR